MATPMSATDRVTVSAVAELFVVTGSKPPKVAVAVALAVPGTAANAVMTIVAEAPLPSDVRAQLGMAVAVVQEPAVVVALDTFAPVTGIVTLTVPAFGPALRTVTV